MAKYDTEIRLHSDLDNSKLDKGAEHIEKKLDELEEKAKDTSLTPEGWSKEDWDKFEKNFDSIMERNKKKAEEAAAEMAKASATVGETIAPLKEKVASIQSARAANAEIMGIRDALLK